VHTPGRAAVREQGEGELVRAQHSGCWLSLTALYISKRLTKQISTTHVNRTAQMSTKKSLIASSSAIHTRLDIFEGHSQSSGTLLLSLEVLTILEMSKQHSSSLNSRLHKRVHSHFLTRMLFFTASVGVLCPRGLAVAPGSGRRGSCRKTARKQAPRVPFAHDRARSNNGCPEARLTTVFGGAGLE
jgi:hypothetical protein